MKILTLLLSSWLILHSTNTFSAVDWVAPQGNPGHTGYVEMTTNPDNYHTLWEHDLIWKGTIVFNIQGPVRADGVIVLIINDHIVAYDTNTGVQKWLNEGANKDFQYLYYLNGQLVSTEYTDFARINFYDTTTGYLSNSELVYQYSGLMGTYDSNLYFYKRDRNDSSLISWSRKTGKQNWAEQADMKLYPNHALSKNYIITPTDHHGLLVRDRESGGGVFHIHIDDAVLKTTSHDKIVLDSDSNTAFNFYVKTSESNPCLYALDLNKKGVRWVLPDQNADMQPVVVNNMVFDIDAKNPRLNAIDLYSGEILWAWYAPNGDEINTHMPLVATSDAIFVTGKNYIYAVSLKTTKTVWKTEKQGSLALGDHKLFIYKAYPKDSLTAIALN